MTIFLAASRSSTVLARTKKTNPKDSDPSPPRITSNVKQRLQILRLWWESEKRKSSPPRSTTSYRKKKVTKEELPDDTTETTITLYDENQELEVAVPVLLVDGYNGAFIWSCKALISEASQKEFEQILSASSSNSIQGKLLKHNLDPLVVDALKDLKRQLTEKQR